ncbi:MAG: HNH endonuclease [Acidobacteria bacterium]|nr:HNH endonuclease [Acidobacteriota bacterium]
MPIDAATRRRVCTRARYRCEYCHLHQDFSELTHHFEHIRPVKHGGTDQPDNLALACHRCNSHKGSNLSGIDPKTGKLTPLFHPRKQRWPAHFRFDGPLLIGLSPTGRTTIQTLAMNDPRRLALRAELLSIGELT